MAMTSSTPVAGGKGGQEDQPAFSFWPLMAAPTLRAWTSGLTWIGVDDYLGGSHGDDAVALGSGFRPSSLLRCCLRLSTAASARPRCSAAA